MKTLTPRGAKQSPAFIDFIQLALNTGMRRSEILKLEIRNIDTEYKRIHLDGAQTKNGKRRVIPLNAHALSAIQSRIQANDKNGLSGTRLFLQKTGAPSIRSTPHSKTRSTTPPSTIFGYTTSGTLAASWLVQSGVTLPG